MIHRDQSLSIWESREADRRARELPASYCRPLEKLDQRRGIPAGELDLWWCALMAYQVVTFVAHPLS